MKSTCLSLLLFSVSAVQVRKKLIQIKLKYKRIKYHQIVALTTDPTLYRRSPVVVIFIIRGFYTGSGANAFANALIIGALNGAFFSSDGSVNELMGTCYYGDPQHSAISSPCIRNNVDLLDDQNNVIASTSTNENGDFRFFIASGKSYLIQVSDQKGRSAVLNKKFDRQANVSIFFKALDM